MLILESSQFMKINILYHFQSGPWGGGNQFLKALTHELERQGVYTSLPQKADVILFNSHHQLGDALKIKLKSPEKAFIHRLGTVFYYHRGNSWKKYDKAIITLTNKMSDGVVFQSVWSKKQANQLGFSEEVPCQVIYNAVDPSLFNRNNKKSFNPQEKIKLVSLSWSVNKQKGFEVYKFLDENLDFSKYEMTFVGNSSVQFKNIKMIKPMISEKVAEVLKQNDIFIFAAKHEACSNALIEAMSSGLPVVAVDSASNTEIVKEGGLMFQNHEAVPAKIEKIVENYQHYQSKLPEFSIKDVARQYYEFGCKIYEENKQSTKYKKLGLSAKLHFYKLKVFQKLC